MKKMILSLTAVFSALVSPAFALETKGNAVACITQKKLVHYNKLVEENAEEYISLMQNKAECVPMKTPFSVYIRTEVGAYVEVERTDGMRFWMNRADII